MGDSLEAYEKLPRELGTLLFTHEISISLAESCTGGLISHRITQIPGASRFFEGAVVSYSNDSKISILGVQEDTITQNGAVSEWTARQMAEGVRKLFQTDLGCSVTGIAGPDGGSPEKPIGTVYIAISSNKGTQCWHFHFTGSREDLKLKTSSKALELMISHVKKLKQI
ncbi:MAG: CinA family protein [Candidatus Auribacterota bacterium]